MHFFFSERDSRIWSAIEAVAAVAAAAEEEEGGGEKWKNRMEQRKGKKEEWVTVHCKVRTYGSAVVLYILSVSYTHLTLPTIYSV